MLSTADGGIWQKAKKSAIADYDASMTGIHSHIAYNGLTVVYKSAKPFHHGHHLTTLLLYHVTILMLILI
jgi:hypothetical protein